MKIPSSCGNTLAAHGQRELIATGYSVDGIVYLEYSADSRSKAKLHEGQILSRPRGFAVEE
jgi:hypothetical protein